MRGSIRRKAIDKYPSGSRGFGHHLPVLSMDPAQDRNEPRYGAFATTHWSVVERAGNGDSPEATLALERLCQTYWYPLYVFVRRKGHTHEDACDLTQTFFARFLEKDYLRSVRSELGKFRTFLLTSMTHFLANEWDKTQAQRRGGQYQFISLEAASADERYFLESEEHATPEAVFEKRWAEALMAVVLNRLAAETNEERFAVLKTYLLDDKGAVSYETAGRQLALSVPALTSAIHRMRARFRVLLLEEIATTVQSPGEVEAELRHLLAALSH